MKRRKLKKQVFALLMCICIIMSSTAVIFAAPDSQKSSDADGIGTSMYDVSTALAAYANSVVGANTNDKHNDHKVSEVHTVGSAGALVGYGDPKKDFYAYISSNTAKSVTTSSYDAWLQAGDSGASYAYVRYGHLLADLGLDKVGANDPGQGRWIFGSVMHICHSISGFVPSIFSFSVTILKKLNPFQFFIDDNYVLGERTVGTVESNDDGTLNVDIPSLFDGSGNINTPSVSGTGDNFAAETYGSKVSAEMPAFLQPLRQMMTEIYAVSQSIGLFVIIPLLLAFFIFNFLMSARNAKADQALPGVWPKLKMILLRLVFIVIGIPVLGSLYTATLDVVSVEMKTSPAGSRVVACTFVDFQSWAQTSRLGLPSGVQLISEGASGENSDSTGACGSASTESLRSLRNSVLSLNQTSGVISQSLSGIGLSSSGDDSSLVNPGMIDTNGQLIADTADNAVKNQVSSLLTRYGDGNFYQASAWDSAVNSALSKNHRSQLGSKDATANAGSNEGTVYEMYDETDECADWLDREVADNANIFNGAKWQGFNIFSNDALAASGSRTIDGTINYNGGGHTGSASDPAIKCGLSSVSMYNYLSSVFENGQISVYSGMNSTSEFTKNAHYSVNLVGSGVMGYLFGANCLSVLGIITLIGVVYGLGMLINTLKRGVSLMIKVPTAMMGAISSIVQVAFYAVGMILELLGTVFVYQFVTDLFVVFASIIETPIQEAVYGAGQNATETTIIGGKLAFIGNVDMSNFIQNNRYMFMFGMTFIVICLLFAGIELFLRRRALLSVLEYVCCLYMRYLTLPVFRPVFDQWMADRKSLYVWDILYDISYSPEVLSYERGVQAV